MEKQVLNTVRKYNLIKENDTVIVGLSGGADSVSLILALNNLKKILKIKKIIGVHLNHNLRETAKRDEEFSRRLCENLKIDFYSKTEDIKTLKDDLKVCEEDAGRIARYNFFFEIKEKTGADKIATAHNKNDQAETFFIRLLRGSGAEGLSSIKPLREDGVIRPLIETSRNEIIKYLEKNSQDFVTDETNLTSDYLRNKIRLELIPYLKENFDFKDELIVRAADSLREDSEFINKEVEMCFKNSEKGENFIKFKLEYLNTLSPAVLSRLIVKSNEYVGGKKLLRDTVLLVMNIVKTNKTGKGVPLSKETQAVCEYGELVIKKSKESKPYCYEIKPGKTCIGESGITVILEEGIKNTKDSINIPDFSSLTVRTRKDGDRMYIKNTGHKKLKDIFTDRKIPKDKRDIFPVVCLDNEIVWLYNMYKKDFEDSKYNLRIKWKNN